MLQSKSMIACVTFETTKIIEPVVYYGVDRIHIIHYVKEDAPSAPIYQDFYDTVCEQIKRKCNATIIEHIAKVYDYQIMLKTITQIIRSEENNKIYVNVSSGTSEYAAASMIASNMSDNTIPFTVGTKEYTVSMEKIKELYTENGNLVGLSKTVYDPKVVETFGIDPPDQEMVKCLSVINELALKKIALSSKNIIPILKEKDIWSYKCKKDNKRTPQELKELMYFKRHYINKLSEFEWIEQCGKKYKVTEEGSHILEIFTDL